MAAGILERLITNARIDVVSVTYRAKSVESAIEKVTRKGYQAPQSDMTDLAGVRVIAFVEKDLVALDALIRKAFAVLPDKSSDRSAQLGVDRTGYRSHHYVCLLGDARVTLPEHEVFKGFTFEVQLRTALQHAWAEVEHNRRYKFAGILPEPLQRRLFLLAGMLEIADREFSAIATEIDTYADSVRKSAQRGELEIDVNSTSVATYLMELTNREQFEIFGRDGTTVLPIVIEEMRAFGVATLADLDRLFSPEMIVAVRKHEKEITFIGLLRDAMMFEDIQRYFKEAWQDHWGATDRWSYDMFVERYGRDTVTKAFAGRIHVIDEYEHEYDPDDDFDAADDA